MEENLKGVGRNPHITHFKKVKLYHFLLEAIIFWSFSDVVPRNKSGGVGRNRINSLVNLLVEAFDISLLFLWLLGGQEHWKTLNNLFKLNKTPLCLSVTASLEMTSSVS